MGNPHKIVIVGSGFSARNIAFANHAKKLNIEVEFISPEQAEQMNVPKVTEFKIATLPQFESFFQPPITRAERRKKQRKIRK